MNAEREVGPTGQSARDYWEARASRFAHDRGGLAAVCSYGMPTLYNWAIHAEQKRALASCLPLARDLRVLDAGCGVGRWSEWLAARGGLVTGVDISATMIREARRRLHRAGLGERCRFLVCDLTELAIDGSFDLILISTVLQHVMTEADLSEVILRLAARLRPGGTLIALEAAPVDPHTKCNSSVFLARSRRSYTELFARAGLVVERVIGVDPAPFRTALLARSSRSRPPTAWLSALVTGLSVPFNLLLAPCLTDRSWHAVFVARRGGP